MQLYLTRDGKALFAMVVGLVTETNTFCLEKAVLLRCKKKKKHRKICKMCTVIPEMTTFLSWFWVKENKKTKGYIIMLSDIPRVTNIIKQIRKNC